MSRAGNFNEDVRSKMILPSYRWLRPTWGLRGGSIKDFHKSKWGIFSNGKLSAIVQASSMGGKATWDVIDPATKQSLIQEPVGHFVDARRTALGMFSQNVDVAQPVEGYRKIEFRKLGEQDVSHLGVVPEKPIAVVKTPLRLVQIPHRKAKRSEDEKDDEEGGRNETSLARQLLNAMDSLEK
jgi:hypothetical protein